MVIDDQRFHRFRFVVTAIRRSFIDRHLIMFLNVRYFVDSNFVTEHHVDVDQFRETNETIDAIVSHYATTAVIVRPFAAVENNAHRCRRLGYRFVAHSQFNKTLI